jgi:hypothetical protein
MPITDNEPFDASPVPYALGLVRDDPSASRTRAEVLRAMRQRMERWGSARGFEVAPRGLVRIAEGVEVTIELSNTTPEICTLRSNALQPTELRVRIEPKSWTDWIATRLGPRFETADRAFDELWHVETDNDAVAKQLLDTRLRTALTNHPIWCRLEYMNGRIDLHLDSGSERLTGDHLLAAAEVAIALSVATPQLPSTPYRG